MTGSPIRSPVPVLRLLLTCVITNTIACQSVYGEDKIPGKYFPTLSFHISSMTGMGCSVPGLTMWAQVEQKLLTQPFSMFYKNLHGLTVMLS